MSFDIVQVRSLLKVNGISPETTSPEELTASLRAAFYAEEDIPAIIAALGASVSPAKAPESSPIVPNPAPLPPQDAELAILQSTQVEAVISAPSPVAASTPAVSASVSSLERIFGALVFITVVGLYALFFVNLSGRSILLHGWSNETVLPMIVVNGGPILVILLVLLALAYFLARFSARGVKTLTLWYSHLFLHLFALWYLALYGVVWFIQVTRFGAESDPDGLGRSIMVSFGRDLSLFLLAPVGLVAFLVAFLTHKKVATGTLRRILFTTLLVLGIGLLIYVSGALKYPANALNVRFVCYGIAEESVRKGCLSEAVAVPDSGDVPFELIAADVLVSGGSSSSVVGGVKRDAFVSAANSLWFVGMEVPKELTASARVSMGLYKDGERLPISEEFQITSEIVKAGEQVVVLGRPLTEESRAFQAVPIAGKERLVVDNGNVLIVNGNKTDTSLDTIDRLISVNDSYALIGTKDGVPTLAYEDKTYSLASLEEKFGEVVGIRGGILYVYWNATGEGFLARDGTVIAGPKRGFSMITPVGDSFLYVALEAKGAEKPYTLVMDGTETPFSGRLISAAVIDGKPALYMSENEFWVGLNYASLIHSYPGGIMLGESKPTSITFGGVTYSGFDQLSQPQELDGKLAFAAMQNGELSIYVEGQKTKSFLTKGTIMNFMTTPEGRWLAVVTRTHVDGVPADDIENLQGYVEGKGGVPNVEVENRVEVYVDGQLLPEGISYAVFFGEHLMTVRHEEDTVLVYADGQLLAADIQMNAPSFIDGKAITTGLKTVVGERNYFIVAQKGLLGDEVKKRLQAE